MIEVKVTKAHLNAYGDKVRKAVGKTYSLPEEAARQLAAQGLVELPKEAKAKGEADPK